MSWRDSLTWAEATDQLRKKASFRGATFFVRDSDISGGRRNTVHQYPMRDNPYIEDLGADTDEFTIQGYVIQSPDNNQNYLNERNSLITALKEKGPGTLIHPFYGTLTVSLIGKYRIAETFTRGGIARFTMTFIKAEETSAPFPSEVIDHINAVDEVVEKSLDDGKDGTGRIYEGEDVPDFSSNSILDALSSLNKMMRSVISSIHGAGPAQISRATTILSEAYEEVYDLTTIENPCTLADGMVQMGNSLLSLIGAYGEIMENKLYGPCSDLVRGVMSGPMSGAQPNIPETQGFTGSTLSSPATIEEDFGTTVVNASLALADFGKTMGDEDPSAYGGSLESISITTASRARQAANREALINMARLMAITTATRTAIRISYASHDKVVEIMENVLAAIDAQLLKLGNDAANTNYATYDITVADPDQYQALRRLRPVFVKSMLGIGANLAKIIDYEVPPTTMPSLIVAYDKYEDLGREKEIINRNIPLIKNPGFLPEGKTLELLNE